jgi:HEAT repeat protein
LREEIVSAIGQIGDPSVLPAIEPLLDDSHAEVRRAAIVAVGQLGATNAVPKLVSILNSAGAGDIQRAVVGALANIGEPSTSDVIISRLGSMPGDRSELIWALAHTGGSNAPAAIAPLLDGRDREERFAAAFALVALRDRTIVPQLKARATDKDEFARHAKGCALVMLGDPLGLDDVREGLKAKEIWRRFASALALTYPGGAGKPEDAAALENDRSGVIANFAKTARSEDPVRALIALLATKHDEMPTYAAKALWFFDDPRALPELKKATERTDSGLREAARTAIMRIERRTAQTPGPTPTAAR